jgi:hypothetical protein
MRIEECVNIQLRMKLVKVFLACHRMVVCGDGFDACSSCHGSGDGFDTCPLCHNGFVCTPMNSHELTCTKTLCCDHDLEPQMANLFLLFCFVLSTP